MHQLALRAIDELGQALQDFGTYSFDDKGAGEVMDLGELEAALRRLVPAEAALVLTEVAKDIKHRRRGLKVAEELVLSLQDWDALFDEPGIDDLMNGELPA
jgi:hypothetical protein